MFKHESDTGGDVTLTADDSGNVVLTMPKAEAEKLYEILDAASGAYATYIVLGNWLSK